MQGLEDALRTACIQEDAAGLGTLSQEQMEAALARAGGSAFTLHGFQCQYWNPWEFSAEDEGLHRLSMSPFSYEARSQPVMFSKLGHVLVLGIALHSQDESPTWHTQGSSVNVAADIIKACRFRHDD